MNKRFLTSRHYFNDIAFARWPFFMGWSIFMFLLCFVLYIKNVGDASHGIRAMSLFLMFAFFITLLFNWFNAVEGESIVSSRYGRKLRAALVCGFMLFLVSEIMLFGGFFWAYFDRVFNPGYVNTMCIPTGMERIDFWRWPLVGTVVLLTSGYYANKAYYELRAGSLYGVMEWGIPVLGLALTFLCIQLVEYNGLNLTMSDNVYGSFFYLLTGFHGFHVTIGFLFLCEQIVKFGATWKACRWRTRIVLMNRDRHLGLAFAVIYWHFVDIIWLFLYFSVYVYNTDNLSEGLAIVVELSKHDFEPLFSDVIELEGILSYISGYDWILSNDFRPLQRETWASNKWLSWLHISALCGSVPLEYWSVR